MILVWIFCCEFDRVASGDFFFVILVWIFRFVVILLGWHVDFWCLFDLGDFLL